MTAHDLTSEAGVNKIFATEGSTAFKIRQKSILGITTDSHIWKEKENGYFLFEMRPNALGVKKKKKITTTAREAVRSWRKNTIGDIVSKRVVTYSFHS